MKTLTQYAAQLATLVLGESRYVSGVSVRRSSLFSFEIAGRRVDIDAAARALSTLVERVRITIHSVRRSLAARNISGGRFRLAVSPDGARVRVRLCDLDSAMTDKAMGLLAGQLISDGFYVVTAGLDVLDITGCYA